MAWNQLAAELWTRIAEDCDKDGVRALCSYEMSRHIRDSALPVYFRHLSFGAKNILADIDLSNNNACQYPMSLERREERARQRFTELPSSILVYYVRSWTYIGSPAEQRDLDDTELTSDQSRRLLWDQAYDQALWPVFIANLSRYIGMTKLDLEDVVMHNAAMESINTLTNLKTLTLFNVVAPTSANFAHSLNHLISLSYWPGPYDFRAEVVIGVCPTLTNLDLLVAKAEYRELYYALAQCPVLETLIIGLGDNEEEAFERPEAEGSLPITACPNLSNYIGHAYFAPGIITGRPVHSIKLSETPEHAEHHPECIDWLREFFGGGSTPVKTLDFPSWTAYNFSEETFPMFLRQFPQIESLRVVVEVLLVIQDDVLYLI